MEKVEYIYGIRPVIEAINSGKEIDKVLIQKGLHSELYLELRKLINQYQLPSQFVPVEKLNRVTRKNHQGIIAFLSSITYTDIENVIPFLFEQGKNPLILILDRITDVGNFGAIARTALCTGVDAIVIPYYNSVRVSSDALKASAGALNHITVCKSKSLIKTIEFMKSSGLQIIAASEKSDKDFLQSNFILPTAIIMGSEDTGISEQLIKSADKQCVIKTTGSIASLNVSVATGILLYEVFRQRNLK